MPKLLINEDGKQIGPHKGQPIIEYKHNFVIKTNRSYAIGLVDKAINSGNTTITIDPTKLNIKVYKSTDCALYGRDGNALCINNTDPIFGQSKPQHGDRFNKSEGRKQATLNAVSRMKFNAYDPNYTDLLAAKLHLRFDANCRNLYTYLYWHNPIQSWQFLDVWNALAMFAMFPDEIHAATLKEQVVKFVGEKKYNRFHRKVLMPLYALNEFQYWSTTNDSIEICYNSFCGYVHYYFHNEYKSHE